MHKTKYQKSTVTQPKFRSFINEVDKCQLLGEEQQKMSSMSV